MNRARLGRDNVAGARKVRELLARAISLTAMLSRMEFRQNVPGAGALSEHRLERLEIVRRARTAARTANVPTRNSLVGPLAYTVFGAATAALDLYGYAYYAEDEASLSGNATQYYVEIAITSY